MQRLRQHEQTHADGSRTLVMLDTAPREGHPADPSSGSPRPEDDDRYGGGEGDEGVAAQPTRPLVLNLRGGGSVRKGKKPGQRVVWKEDVIDNEGSGKKKSKICCIYHKPKRWDESSDESSDGSDCEDEHHSHNHSTGRDAQGASSNAMASSSTTITSLRNPEPNAYEHQPHHRPVP
ncbi:Type 1 phosphatases regulator ypi1 [Serendipita sp. 405]|nr:Type 1 phosphatases regulator ypi1 [Serendipita sp. 397]KAG8781213.1 Type 1 phosphatases regulator ypi1 [Serendipita sp. 398]KAG8846132.1 Type 1 phosphatases regulator ypi1 [Serendipita sp. 405]